MFQLLLFPVYCILKCDTLFPTWQIFLFDPVMLYLYIFGGHVFHFKLFFIQSKSKILVIMELLSQNNKLILSYKLDHFPLNLFWGLESLHGSSQPSVISPKGTSALFWPLWETGTHMVHRPKCTQNTHTCKNIKKYFLESTFCLTLVQLFIFNSYILYYLLLILF